LKEAGAAVETELPHQSRGRVHPAPTIRAAVAGARGYAGRELIAWLRRHPQARLTRFLSSGQKETEAVPLDTAHPALRAQHGEDGHPLPSSIEPLGAAELTLDDADVVFLATAHEASSRLVPQFLSSGLRVIDLSGAFRLKDPAAYPRWYGFEHPAAGPVLEEAVYGLPELNREAIAGARLVANPGCYATAAILALAPLVSAGWIETSAGIICDAKSGATGAGRAPSEKLHFAEVNENCRAYGLFNHRHVPEILQLLNLAESDFTFTPHLLPVNRGILATVYARLAPPAARATLNLREVVEQFRNFYAASPLVRVIAPPALPEIQWVAHTPYADLGFALDEPSRRLIVVSALDNLVKGAAGQAIQNMNLMFGLGEETGLV
jgi:N-acetyl-gamma-glutamyl-phosphate reductase